MGKTEFSPGGAEFTSMVMDNNGAPYVAFRDIPNGNKVIVMKTSFDP